MKSITNKIIASSMLAMFTLSNALPVCIAMEDVNSRPILRDDQNYSLKLKGDISYIRY